MSSESIRRRPAGERPNRTTRVRFAMLWVVVTLIALPLVIWVIGPLLGPGNGSEQARAVRAPTTRCWPRWRRRC